jgi:ABC-2 type transport system permease protein
MIAALKAEFRKLLTVRSTYIVTVLVTLLMLFVAGYIEGWRLTPQDLQNPAQFSGDVFGALSLSVFGAIIAILLVTHEYRYNTIMYTLTSSNSRSKVLLAKIVTISVYAVFLTLLVGILSPIASNVGIHLHGHTLVPQTLHVGDLIWRSLFYGWAYGMAGLLLAVLIRVQVGAIAALFLIPGLVEQLLGQLMKSNSVYLPFSALDQVIGNSNVPQGHLAPGKAALVFCVYLVVGWIVAWALFLKRDAN